MNEINEMYQQSRENGVNPVRNIRVITGEIRLLREQTQRIVLGYAVEIGRRLVEAKSMLSHGEWLPWLKDEAEFSVSTAERMMKLFNEYGADQIGILGAEVNSSLLKNLSISNALRLLSVPESERESFAEEVDAENLSTRELEKVIKERDTVRQERDRLQHQSETWEQRAQKAQSDLEKAEKNANDAQQDFRDAQTEAEQLRQKVKELEARKPEVKTVRDEAAIKDAEAKAKATADAEWKKKIEEQKIIDEQNQKKIDKLRADLAEAQEKAKTASDAAEKKQLEDEVERLKKQVAMSDKAVTEAGLHFQAWQTAFNQLSGAVDRIEDNAKADKLRAAIRAQLTAWTAAMEG